MSGASGQLGRDEVPVAQDHRREDAAGRGGEDGQLQEQAGDAERRRRPTPAPRR